MSIQIKSMHMYNLFGREKPCALQEK